MGRVDETTRSRILRLLETTDKDLIISDIVKYTQLTRPSIYLHLDILEKKGLIKREKDTTKKGAPVKIIPIKSKINSDKKRRMIELLDKIKNKGGEINMHDLESIHEGILNPSTTAGMTHIDLRLRGLIGSKLYITQKGKKFLKEHGKKSTTK